METSTAQTTPAVPTTIGSPAYCYKPEDDPWIRAIQSIDCFAGITDDQQMAKLVQQQNNLPIQICAGLYLGDGESAETWEHLHELGIQRILNMAGIMEVSETAVKHYRRLGMTLKVIEAEDVEDFPLLEKHWDEAHAFIQDGVSHNEVILVHCMGGWNRSVLIVAAEYLMRHNGSTNVVETMRHIRHCRGNGALHNEGFQQQLVAFAREHGMLGPKPVHAHDC